MDELKIPYDQWHTIPYKSKVMPDGSLKIGLYAMIGYWERKNREEAEAIERVKREQKGYVTYRSPVGRCS